MADYNREKRRLKFMERARAAHGDRYLYNNVVFIDSIHPIIVTCREHGDWSVLPPNHTHRKSGCPKCCGGVLRDAESVIREARSVHGNRYLYTDFTYVGLHKKATIICREHGPFSQTVSDHINNGSGCPQCKRVSLHKQKVKDITWFVSKANEKHGNKYDYSDTAYSGAHTLVSIKCPKHGVFKQSANSHVRGSGCLRCRVSTGEVHVREALDNMNVKYNEQVTFDGCRNIRPLRFDFVVYYRSRPAFAIEVQGHQHYQKVMFSSTGDSEKRFTQIRQRDAKKRSFCRSISLPLVCVDMRKNSAILNQLIEAFTKTTGSKRWKI